MRKIHSEELIHILESLGIQGGDGLLIHSAVQYLGQPESRDTDQNYPGKPQNEQTAPGGAKVASVGIYYDAVCQVINCHPFSVGTAEQRPLRSPQGSTLPQGTLAVPTFNFSFGRGEVYDPKNTPSQGMGVFSEYVRNRPQAMRTLHPMQSIAVVGLWAPDLVSRDTASAFDPGSAFERMLELDFKLLLLGADIQAVSMVHYSEQRAQVPYRYWKDFTGPVIRSGDSINPETRTYRMYVRNLDINPQLNLHPIQEELERSSLWHSVAVNYGKISTCRLTDFVTITDQLLKKNPWILVSNALTKTDSEVTDSKATDSERCLDDFNA